MVLFGCGTCKIQTLIAHIFPSRSQISTGIAPLKVFNSYITMVWKVSMVNQHHLQLWCKREKTRSAAATLPSKMTTSTMQIAASSSDPAVATPPSTTNKSTMQLASLPAASASASVPEATASSMNTSATKAHTSSTKFPDR